jgi:hypothetical protein
MSPGYGIRDGKVHPTLKLTKGPPDEGISLRHIEEEYEKIFCITEKG